MQLVPYLPPPYWAPPLDKASPRLITILRFLAEVGPEARDRYDRLLMHYGMEANGAACLNVVYTPQRNPTYVGFAVLSVGPRYNTQRYFYLVKNRRLPKRSRK